MVHKEKPFKLILVDPDPKFAKSFSDEAGKYPLEVDYFKTMQDIVYLGVFNSYDVAVLNTDIGQVSGWEIAEYIEKFRVGLPVVLLSNQSGSNLHPQGTVVKYLSKATHPLDNLVREVVGCVIPMPQAKPIEVTTEKV